MNTKEETIKIVKERYYQLFIWLENNAKNKCLCQNDLGIGNPPKCPNCLKLIWTNDLMDDLYDLALHKNK